MPTAHYAFFKIEIQLNCVDVHVYSLPPSLALSSFLLSLSLSLPLPLLLVHVHSVLFEERERECVCMCVCIIGMEQRERDTYGIEVAKRLCPFIFEDTT